MKRNLLLILMMLLPMIASANDSGKCGDNVTYTYVGSTQTLTISGTGPMASYGQNGEPWYSYRSEIIKVIIENGVTSIGNLAFEYCRSLTSVTIPNSVKSIGSYAFWRCFDLPSITIPNTVESIGKAAFYECHSMASITIPNSVTSIGDWAFADCRSLTSVTIPNSVKSIGEMALTYCTALSSIVVESGNTKYDSRQNCNAIIETASNSLIYGCMNTVIPSTVTCIGDGAFSMCSGLTSVTIPSSVTCIGKSAFSSCTGLTSVTIPNSVTSIGYSAFEGCSGLTSVTIPNSVTSIEPSTFDDCISLTSVTFGNSVTSIGDGAFAGCSSLPSITIPNSVTSIGHSVFMGCRSLTSVTIPNSVKSIGAYAFRDCSSLTSITILDNNFINFGYAVFESCTGLTDFYCYVDGLLRTDSQLFLNSSIASATLHVPASVLDAYKKTEPWSGFGNFVAFEDVYTNIQFADATVKAICVDNWDTNGDGELSKAEAASVTSLQKKFNNTTITSFDELQYFTGLTSIGESEFTWCRNLTSITIPDRVTTIGLMAFFFCEGLKSITFGNELTSIGECVFWNCNSLTSFSIPESVTSIGESTFRNCTNLTDVYCYAKNVPSTGKELFESTPIESATLHVPSSAFNDYKRTEPWSGFGTIISLDGKTQCATPTISYANGELTFNCATEGALCQSTITDADIASYSSNKVKLSVTYHISVFATKENFIDSDVVTATLCWIEQQPDMEGITDDEDAVAEVKAIPVLIQTEGSTITVQGAKEGTDIAVYSVDGTKEGSSIAGNGHAVISTNLRSGSVAIVKIGEKAVKVAIK